MISISHSPNSTLSQQLKALMFLVLPWNWAKWKNGNDVAKLEQALGKMHGAKHAISFSSGREGLYAILKAMGISKGDEVIIQPYTCIVVPNAIVWNGAKPVYVDIDQTLNIDPSLIEQKICSKTKAIIVQHAFGVPAQLDAIKKIALKNNIFLIEDCALSLGARFDNNLVGTYGDAAFFSFGRDKIVSSVSGGVVITNNETVYQRLSDIHQKASHRSVKFIWQNLNHAILLPIINLLMGRHKIGQLKLILAQKIGLLNKVYTEAEKESVKPSTTIYKCPNAMAALALQQINENLGIFNVHRRKLSDLYHIFFEKNNISFQKTHSLSEPAYLRPTCLLENPEEIVEKMKKKGYLLGNWYRSPIMPQPKLNKTLNYTPGSCPVAEKWAGHSLNLPTHHKLSIKKAKKMINLLQSII